MLNFVKQNMLKVAAISMIAGGAALATPASAAVTSAPTPVASTFFGDMATTASETVSNDYHRRYKKRNRYYSNSRYNRGYNSRYDRNRNYRNRNYYRCDKGNGGLAIGAVVGGLAGHEIAGRGDRTLGTIIGAGVGAIAGREIDRSNDGCR